MTSRGQRSGRALADLAVVAGLALLLALLLAVLQTACSPVRSLESEPLPPATSAGAVVRTLLDDVRRVARRPDLPGYDRSCSPGDGCVFGTDWSDATEAPLSRNGCDTRNDVLGATLVDVEFSERSNGCDVVAGLLVDPYTGDTLDYATDGSQIHIDHLFPLAAAWDLGAASWSAAERATFANDPDLELLAVSGTANLSKGDSTPADWLPPDADFHCSYVRAYLEVALAYDLAITDADRAAMERVLVQGC
ncbi:HNH endonuclease family protein [Nocardioides sp.]|uniref:HNH endonuclease family protein n=1 Tax=Nocardioides sp. TaxID=35761 RepID=UPI002B274A26|nr:HNH endonuclease family protein [Nocardioides sp.]